MRSTSTVVLAAVETVLLASDITMTVSLAEDIRKLVYFPLLSVVQAWESTLSLTAPSVVVSVHQLSVPGLATTSTLYSP